MAIQYQPVITLGAILQIITVLGGCIAGYVVLVGNDIKHDERILANANEITRVERKMDAQIASRNVQMDALNRTLQNLDEKVTRFIITDLESKLKDKNAATRNR